MYDFRDIKREIEVLFDKAVDVISDELDLDLDDEYELKGALLDLQDDTLNVFEPYFNDFNDEINELNEIIEENG